SALATENGDQQALRSGSGAVTRCRASAYARWVKTLLLPTLVGRCASRTPLASAHRRSFVSHASSVPRHSDGVRGPTSAPCQLTACASVSDATWSITTRSLPASSDAPCQAGVN